MTTEDTSVLNGRLLVVAFEGWNDAAEAASGAVDALKDALDVVPLAEVDSDLYYDYQLNRPILSMDDEAHRTLEWPGATL